MTTYARRLGLFSGTMAVMGGIIGAGIFISPRVVAARTGTAGLTLAAWGIGGIVALAGALCFAELGARRPRAGGGYVYLRDAFGGLPAFLYGWVLLLVIATGATGAVAVTFASYAVPLLGLPAGAALPLAVGAIAFAAGVNYVGVAPGAVAQNVFTILKLAALAALIVTGLALASPSTILHQPPRPPPSAGLWTATAALGAALVPVLFTYGGWQQTNFVAEEIVDAERTLPRALVLGVAGVVVVYVLANVAYVRVLGPAGLAASTAPAADVMRAALGAPGASLIAAGIAASTLGFLVLVLLVTPRVFQAMAADGVFIAALARLHPRYRTPAGAIAVMAAWAVVLTWSGTYDELLDYVTFGDWIFFGLTAGTLFVYRRRDPAATGFRAPGYPWVPIVFVAAAAAVVASAVGVNPRNAGIGTAIIAAGVPAYFVWRRAGGSGNGR